MRDRVFFYTSQIQRGCTLGEGKKVTQAVTPLYSAAAPEFRQATGALLGGNFVAGNSITTLENDREILPAMLTAIQGAKQTINFETYVYWDGEVAKRFAAALAERARAGVKVDAILDAQGTGSMGSENLALLENAGVTVMKHHSIVWFDALRRTRQQLPLNVTFAVEVDGKSAGEQTQTITADDQ